MTEYENIMSRLTEMRVRYDSGFSSSDRSYIEHLYRALLSKTIKNIGCGDCYRDAFIETYLFLKRTGTMPTKPNYILKAGVVVHPKGTNQFYANTNIPDEIAENYLAEFPNSIVDFLSYPSDYLARVEARKSGKVLPTTDIETLSQEYEKSENLRKNAEEKLVQTEKDLELLKTKLEVAENELELTKEQLKKAEAELEKSNAIPNTPTKKNSSKSGD